jgi:hypothetical protein
MKRLDDTVRKDVRFTRLKRSDLRTIADMVSGGDPKKVEFWTNEFKDMTVDELILRDLPSTKITIARRESEDEIGPTFQVTIGADRAEVYCEDIEEHHALAVRVLQLIESRRLKGRGLSWDITIAMALAVMFGLISAPIERHLKIERADGAVLFTLVPVGLIILLTMARRPGFIDRVRFRPEDEQPVKWRTVAWELTKLFISAGLGFVGGLMVHR